MPRTSEDLSRAYLQRLNHIIANNRIIYFEKKNQVIKLHLHDGNRFLGNIKCADLTKVFELSLRSPS